MKKVMVVVGLILLGIAALLVAVVGVIGALAVMFVGLMLFIALVSKGVRVFSGEETWEEDDDGVYYRRKRRRARRGDQWRRDLYLPRNNLRNNLANFSVPKELYDFRVGGRVGGRRRRRDDRESRDE